MPCPIRQNTNISKLVDKPHKIEKIVKPNNPTQKVRTAPNRPANHPVNGTQMASATA